jgi:hypothetical protein
MLVAILAFTAPAQSASLHPAASAGSARASGTFDVRARGSAVSPGARTMRARITLARQLGAQGVIQSDPVTGTLRFVGRLDGYMTGRSALPAADVAMGYVGSHLAAFGLSKHDLRTFRLARDYVDILGTHHLSWTQSVHGIPAFMAGLKASVMRDGRLINITGSPAHALSAASYTPRVSASSAAASARRSVGATAAARAGDTAKPVLFVAGRGGRLAWETVTRISSDETDLSVVDATTGAVLWRSNMTRSIATGTGLAWQFYASDLVPLGGGTAAPVTFPVNDGSALSGPNAHVYLDVGDDNKPQPSDEVPALSGTDWSIPAILDTTTTSQNCSPDRACTWDASSPFSWKANEAQDAAQVYYFLNNYHDHLAADPIGFTEAAGNFQVTNTSGQGKGGDAVQGQVLDGADTNNGLPDGQHFDNANMTTLQDGVPSVMQMYLFHKARGKPGMPSANGGDDADVVYHEYTHGLSNRLVTYPDGAPALNSYQSASMGEGWSDWYASDYLNNLGLKPDTSAEGDVVMGLYSFNGELRTQPIDCPVGTADPACPGTSHAGSGGYTYGDLANIVPFLDPHTDGEIWLETLWDIRSSLGSNTAETDITRAMELSPPDPSFLDMRNAILQADEVAFGGANQAALWSIFATRGMGFFAASLGGNDLNVVADDSLPPDCTTRQCATITGQVRDSVTHKPVKGVRIAIVGHDSGFDTDLAATTDVAGRYTISNVPVHKYPEITVSRAGYEGLLGAGINVTGDVVLNARVTRDWAALEGGAKVVDFSGPDYSPFGCGPGGLFDLSLGSGWGSKLPVPRYAVVKLPRPVDVTSFGFDPSNTCGDGPDAATKDFAVYTKSAGGHWVLAVSGGALKLHRITTLRPKVGTENVLYVKIVLLSNRGDGRYIDASEFLVHGR